MNACICLFFVLLIHSIARSLLMVNAFVCNHDYAFYNDVRWWWKTIINKNRWAREYQTRKTFSRSSHHLPSNSGAVDRCRLCLCIACSVCAVFWAQTYLNARCKWNKMTTLFFYAFRMAYMYVWECVCVCVVIVYIEHKESLCDIFWIYVLR